jgi:NAD(P)-dependent dehydrogenase (short-subunit alcohol dehydrogenase family)
MASATSLGRLSQRVAIITGASSGIGLATAKLFAKEGANVVATGRNQQSLDKLVADINASGGQALAVVADITNDAQIANVVTQAINAFGQVNILVNNAGVLKGGAVGDDQNGGAMATWDFNMNVNARAPFSFINQTVPHLKEQAHSAIVNVSSVNGMQSFGGTAAYCASKSALDMLMRCASVDLAPFGIRVNNVNPGVVITELQKTGGMDDEAYAGFVQRSIEVTHPLSASLGRCCEPHEIAECILFLADSNTSSYVTGTTLKVDGGRGNLGAR